VNAKFRDVRDGWVVMLRYSDGSGEFGSLRGSGYMRWPDGTTVFTTRKEARDSLRQLRWNNERGRVAHIRLVAQEV
jgi:hypothetical protein